MPPLVIRKAEEDQAIDLLLIQQQQQQDTTTTASAGDSPLITLLSAFDRPDSSSDGGKGGDSVLPTEPGAAQRLARHLRRQLGMARAALQQQEQ